VARNLLGGEPGRALFLRANRFYCLCDSNGDVGRLALKWESCRPALVPPPSVLSNGVFIVDRRKSGSRRPVEQTEHGKESFLV